MWCLHPFKDAHQEKRDKVIDDINVDEGYPGEPLDGLEKALLCALTMRFFVSWQDQG